MATNQYRPDYAVPPGWVLAERLSAQDISRAEFARRCESLGETHRRDNLGESPHRAEDGASVRKGAGGRCGYLVGY